MESACFNAYLLRLLTLKVSKHMEVLSLLLHSENLNCLSFNPFLTYIKHLSMEKHICAMLHPGMWGVHIKILAAATYYNVALYYCCHKSKKGHYWVQCQPLHQPKGGCCYFDHSGSALENTIQPH